MNTYDFVHLAIYAIGGEVKGKTKLQKIIYFFGVLTNMHKELGFNPHYYGPYSSEVAAALDRLKMLDFVTENIYSGGSLDSNGFEVARHDFSLTDEGKKIAEAKKKVYPKFWGKILDVKNQLDSAGIRDTDYMKLSIAAKIYLIKEENNQINLSELSERAKKFGWQIDDSQIRESTDILTRLNLL
ncbi:MAG: hypothetical protein JXR73_23270 [Candidatus Omnitrophica bacterium]|nr:hypothetical protein [Candidatus Omnitrophota bacterium]